MLCFCKRSILSMFGLCLALAVVESQVNAQTKIAFLAGVEKYEKDGFNALNYAEDDALALKAVLEEIGFECEAIVGKNANRKNLNDGLARFYERSKSLTKEDVVLVFFSGHGVQKLVRKQVDGKGVEREEPFFCPVDAHKNDLTTLLSMNEVLKSIQENSASSNNIILVDACRESLDKGSRGGMDGSKIDELSNKIVLFFAAQSGHRSWESRELEHGIFTYYLLKGLRKEAKDNDGEVTLNSLTNYVSKRVVEESRKLLGVDYSEEQVPNVIQNSGGSLVLRKRDTPTRQESSSEALRMNSQREVDGDTATASSKTKPFWDGEIPEPIARRLLDRPVWRNADAQAEIFQTENGDWYVMAVGKWYLSKPSPRDACNLLAHGNLLEVLKGMDAQVVKKLSNDGFQKFVDSSSRGNVPQLPPLADWETENKTYISVLYGKKIEK